MQVHASRVQGMAMPSYRMHVGLEEMPVLPFRETVPWSNELYPRHAHELRPDGRDYRVPSVAEVQYQAGVAGSLESGVPEAGAGQAA